MRRTSNSNTKKLFIAQEAGVNIFEKTQILHHRNFHKFINFRIFRDIIPFKFLF